MTQATPTNFHTFFTDKVLASGESVEQLREVTPAQRKAIEAADAKWEPPSAELIEQFNTAAGNFGRYNETTGYGELNGLTDLTVPQMREILKNGWLEYPNIQELGENVRTNLLRAEVHPRHSWDWYSVGSHSGAYLLYAPTAEVIRITEKDSKAVKLGSNMTGSLMHGCTKLRRVIGAFYVAYITGTVRVSNTAESPIPMLEEAKISGLRTNCYFCAPKLNLESIEFLIDNAKNTAPITVWLHPDAYARITDELFAKAAEKQITLTYP